MVDKLERDGLIAVIISGDYGAGWSTWNTDKFPAENLVFDKELASFVDKHPKDWKGIEAKAIERFPKAYSGGADRLELEWVPKGTEFYVHEYDGMESIRTKKDNRWFIA